VEYFKRVLYIGGIRKKVIRGMRSDRQDDEEEEITRGEVKERLREGKTVEGDGIRGGVEVWEGEAGGIHVGNVQ